MFTLSFEKPLEDFPLGELRAKIGYHLKRSYECFTNYAKHEHLRMADQFAGEIAKRINFHEDCIKN